ncbi:MAG TPA: response regulator [Miltoncostaeaceae bacterium]|nr:response regulator [Miltoncostaeaceae bacterium]
MTSAAPSPVSPAGPVGWAIARVDTIIVSADEAFATLVGAPGGAVLAGRTWPSLVTPAHTGRVAEAIEAQAAGRPWRGVLDFVFMTQPQPLQVEVFGAAGDQGMTVLRVSRAPEPPAGERAGELSVVLAASDATAQIPDPSAAARAVLQAVHQAMLLDWAVALRFSTAGATVHAEVLATYPSAMAGVDRGARWSPLDRAERAVFDSGEPALEGELERASGDRSPLARLPAFGLRSALHMPLFAGGRVAGAVVLYSLRPQAYTAAEGIRLERFVRPLGGRLALPGLPSGEPATPPPLPSMTSPARAAEAPPAAPTPGPAPQPAPPPPAPAPEPPPAPEPESPRDAAIAAEALEAPATEPAPSAPPAPTLGADAEQQMQRLSALSEVVSGVAHELNNPLTAILGYAQILPSLSDDERQQALATIEQESLRASRIVRNLLAFARQHRPTIQSVDVEAVLRRVIEVRRYSLEMDDILIETSLGGLPPLRADEYQLEQVFLNLLNNAQQALVPSGGRVMISTRREGDVAHIYVTDTGPGVPSELTARVFEPFFTTRALGDGAGMGLAIVYGIVAEHGGRVWVERGTAGGAQFVIELPIKPDAGPGRPEAPTEPAPPPSAQPDDTTRPSAPPEPEMPRPAAPPPPAPEPEAPQSEPPRPPVYPEQLHRKAADRPRVLVVDDELPIRSLATEILGSAGYAVDTAASGDEALRLLEAERYDLIVADVRMPRMDGLQLYHHIGDHWPHLRRRVVFITGDAEGDRTAQLLREEGVRYLEKPFNTAALLRAVGQLLAA